MAWPGHFHTYQLSTPGRWLILLHWSPSISCRLEFHTRYFLRPLCLCNKCSRCPYLICSGFVFCSSLSLIAVFVLSNYTHFTCHLSAVLRVLNLILILISNLDLYLLNPSFYFHIRGRCLIGHLLIQPTTTNQPPNSNHLTSHRNGSRPRPMFLEALLSCSPHGRRIQSRRAKTKSTRHVSPSIRPQINNN